MSSTFSLKRHAGRDLWLPQHYRISVPELSDADEFYFSGIDFGKYSHDFQAFLQGKISAGEFNSLHRRAGDHGRFITVWQPGGRTDGYDADGCGNLSADDPCRSGGRLCHGASGDQRFYDYGNYGDVYDGDLRNIQSEFFLSASRCHWCRGRDCGVHQNGEISYEGVLSGNVFRYCGLGSVALVWVYP